MSKDQVFTLKINSQIFYAIVVGLILAIPLTIIACVAMLAPKTAKADNQQNATINPGFNIPPGYALVPTNSEGQCPTAPGGTGNPPTAHWQPAGTAPAPYYNNVINQVINDYSVDKSHDVNINHEHNNNHDHSNNNNNSHDHIHNVNNGSHNGGDSNVHIENVIEHIKGKK